jgi:hypothetical protein
VRARPLARSHTHTLSLQQSSRTHTGQRGERVYGQEQGHGHGHGHGHGGVRYVRGVLLALVRLVNVLSRAPTTIFYFLFLSAGRAAALLLSNSDTKGRAPPLALFYFIDFRDKTLAGLLESPSRPGLPRLADRRADRRADRSSD